MWKYFSKPKKKYGVPSPSCIPPVPAPLQRSTTRFAGRRYYATPQEVSRLIDKYMTIHMECIGCIPKESINEIIQGILEPLLVPEPKEPLNPME
jgi:hypothetical protein